MLMSQDTLLACRTLSTDGMSIAQAFQGRAPQVIAANSCAAFCCCTCALPTSAPELVFGDFVYLCSFDQLCACFSRPVTLVFSSDRPLLQHSLCWWPQLVWSKLPADTWKSLKGHWRVLSLHLLLLFFLLYSQTQARGMGVCDCT